MKFILILAFLITSGYAQLLFPGSSFNKPKETPVSNNVLSNIPEKPEVPHINTNRETREPPAPSSVATKPLKKDSSCEAKGIRGKCEEVHSCLQDGGIIKTDGLVNSCEVSSSEILVCCRKPFKIAHDLCVAWRSYWRRNDGSCVSGLPLIVGGEEAGLGQLPHIAILGTREGRANRWFCGGSLISPHFVLTAGHCVLEKADYRVRLGEHDVSKPDRKVLQRLLGIVPEGLFEYRSIAFESRSRSRVEQTIKVVKLHFHPEYDGVNPYNDIALLQLEKPVIFTERVVPACLPINPNEDYKNKNVTIAGWGRVQYYKHELSKKLLKVKLPTVERLKCWEIIDKINSRLIPRGITPRQMCAGEKGKDSCKGDSGGPLVIQEPLPNDIPCEQTVAGIVSFGPGCGTIGVYTKVSSYLEWIVDFIAPGLIPLE